MGKHTPTRHNRFNRTMALAVAAGISVTGTVQVAAPENSMFTASARAAEIAAENVRTSIVTKDGHDLLQYPKKEVFLDTDYETNDFYQKFHDVTGELNIDIDIPDTAKAGDTIHVWLEGVVFDEGAPTGVTELKIGDDPTPVANVDIKGNKLEHKFVNRMTFTLLENAENYLGKSASFTAPVVIGQEMKGSHNPTFVDNELAGTVVVEDYNDFHGLKINNQERGVNVKHSRTVTYKGFNPPIGEERNNYVDFLPVNLNTGSATGYTHKLQFSPLIVTIDDKGTKQNWDNIVSPDPKTPETRTVTVRLTTDDPNAVPVITQPTFKASDLKELYLYEKGPAIDREKGETATVKSTALGGPKKKATSSAITGTTALDGKDIVITFNNVGRGEELNAHLREFGYFVHPYKVGKAVTNTITTDNGGVEDKLFEVTDTKTITMKPLNGWANGYIPESAIDFEVTVNNQKADTKNEAVTTSDDTATFVATLTNNGQIGESAITIDFPAGVTDSEGRTQKVVDFGSKGFPVGTTKTIELGELTIPDGASANEFKATLANQLRQDKGVPLTDNAWTNHNKEEAFDNYVVSIKPLGDGKYVLIRRDDTQVEGVIDTTNGSVTNVKSDGKGNLIVTIGGKDKTVPLDQVKITESNKGTPDHTITIKVPGEDAFTFNAYDYHITSVEEDKDGNYIVTRSDGETWEINLKDIRDRITALEDKDSPTRKEFDEVKRDLADLTTRVNKEFKKIDNRFTKVEGDINNLRNDLTALENRVTKVEARLTDVEDRTDALTKCLYGAGTAAIPAALSIPLALLTQVQLPGVAQLNTQIQQQIGIYDENLAKMWGQYGGVLQAGAALSVLAGMIGGLAYIANECKPLTQTDAAQATNLGQLSSKLEQGSSRKEK